MKRFKEIVTKYKKMIACSLIGICSLVAVPTLAVIINSGAPAQSLIVVENGHQFITSHKFDENGNVAYCLEAKKEHPNNHDYQEMQAVEDNLYRILRFGYPYHSYTNDANADYFITQLAVWSYLGQINIDNASIVADRNIQANGNRYTSTGSAYTGPLTAEYAKASIKDLIAQATSNQEPQSGSISISPKTSNGTKIGDYLVSEDFTISGTGNTVNSTGNLKLTANRDVPGLKILKDGQYQDLSAVTFKVGDTFRVAVPKYTDTGSLKFKVEGKIEVKKAVFHESNNNNIQDVVVYKPVVVDESFIDAFSFSWEKAMVFGLVRVKKSDADTKKLLSGAEFGLYQGDKKMYSVTVPDTGIATFDKIPQGVYTLKEDKPPINYHKTDKTWEVNIPEGNEDITLDFDVPNKQIVNKIQVMKRDKETKEALIGAEFELSQNGKVIATQTVDASGTTTFEGLKAGKYSLKETKAPVGYELDSEPKEIVIKDSYTPQVIKYDFMNEKKKHEVDIYKFDEETKEPLAGAKFRLLTKDGNPYYWSLKEHPELVTQNVLDVLKEAYPDMELPTLGELKNKLQGVQKEPEAEAEIQPISEQTDKTFIIDSKVLSDEELIKEDIDLENNYIKQGYSSILETDSNGRVVIPEQLSYDEYMLVEVVPPSGYSRLEQPLIFTIDDDNSAEPEDGVRHLTIDVANHRGEGDMELTKKDVSTGELLPNAKFVIYGEDGETVVLKEQTDENGVAKFHLKTGKYFYQEYEAPAGYMIDNRLFPVEIKEDGDIIKCEMTNTKIPKTGTTPIKPLPIVACVGILVLGCAFIYIRSKNEKE